MIADLKTGGRGPRRLSAAILAGAAIAAFAPASPARAQTWTGSCEIRFQGTSTVHDFTGRAKCQPFRIAVEPAPGGSAIIREADVAVLAGGMGTGNRTRDRQMREMLQSDRFPRIRGTFGTIDPDGVRRKLAGDPAATVPLDFTLTIRDVGRPVHAVARNFRESGAEVSFDVEYALSLNDFRLSPPRAFFGLVKVGDGIVVTTAVRINTAGPK